jgi:PadR family transcriptional regulator, regulatory protein PadR
MRALIDIGCYPSILCDMDAPSNPQAAREPIILETLSAGPRHGFGIALHIEKASSALLRVEEGSLYPALHRLEKALRWA